MGNSKSTKADVVTQGMPQRERDLHLAVMGNDRKSVSSLIAQGADINYPWNNPTVPSVKDSTTPLLAAVSLNHVDISVMLLKAGAGINRTDKRNCTPLYKAAFHGRPVLVDILVQAGADINKADLESQTPLYICVQNAIVHSSYATVERLLAAGASVNMADKSGKIPIHVAAHWKLKDMIRILLNANSDINSMDLKGRTPLYVCVSSLSTGLYFEDLKYQVPCIKVLYAAGCDMLNLVDWLKWKGPGIPAEMLSDDDNFRSWYKSNMNSPHTLVNLCRKTIQQQVCYQENMVKVIPRLPVPPKLQTYLSRKMFHLPKP
ncbi:ankyrin repeat, PH and SEC7 domain containing protein secG-like [Haliotis rubra]|uniref:ankyrin repeat, PH and SEC7 domain containing protein secG-like n=1 Tax=Haliotis rubra TaxID=36100 RepID=UPI001EE61AAF|nr:ankyrin repeat, PH and SEC7 domain containing protein secG-like [Haliotis rubra]